MRRSYLNPASVIALYLASYLVGVLGSSTADCLQIFMPNGTTSMTRSGTNGKLEATTVFNPTPLYAPCGSEWTIARETMTVIALDCDETQTRDEPRLTSLRADGAPGPVSITCIFTTPTPFSTTPLLPRPAWEEGTPTPLTSTPPFLPTPGFESPSSTSGTSTPPFLPTPGFGTTNSSSAPVTSTLPFLPIPGFSSTNSTSIIITSTPKLPPFLPPPGFETDSVLIPPSSTPITSIPPFLPPPGFETIPTSTPGISTPPYLPTPGFSTKNSTSIPSTSTPVTSTPSFLPPPGFETIHSTSTPITSIPPFLPPPGFDTTNTTSTPPILSTPSFETTTSISTPATPTPPFLPTPGFSTTNSTLITSTSTPVASTPPFLPPPGFEPINSTSPPPSSTPIILTPPFLPTPRFETISILSTPSFPETLTPSPITECLPVTITEECSPPHAATVTVTEVKAFETKFKTITPQALTTMFVTVSVTTTIRPTPEALRTVSVCGPCETPTPLSLPPTCDQPFYPWEVYNLSQDSNGEQRDIEYTEDLPSSHQLSLVDLDYRDMRMVVYIDGVSAGLTSDFSPDDSIFCGDDVNKCLDNGFSRGTFTIPPGRHMVKITSIWKDLPSQNVATHRMIWKRDLCS